MGLTPVLPNRRVLLLPAGRHAAAARRRWASPIAVAVCAFAVGAAACSGGASTSSTGTTGTVPGAPTNLVATPGNGSGSIAFTAPSESVGGWAPRLALDVATTAPAIPS
mgnify:CR=1 FL=1